MSKKMLFIIVVFTIATMLLSACTKENMANALTLQGAVRMSNDVNDFMANREVRAIKINSEIRNFMGSFGITCEKSVTTLGELLDTLPEAEVEKLWDAAYDVYQSGK